MIVKSTWAKRKLLEFTAEWIKLFEDILQLNIKPSFRSTINKLWFLPTISLGWLNYKKLPYVVRPSPRVNPIISVLNVSSSLSSFLYSVLLKITYHAYWRRNYMDRLSQRKDMLDESTRWIQYPFLSAFHTYTNWKLKIVEQ